MGYDVNINRLEISALFDLKGRAEALADWAGDHLPDFPERANSQTHKDGASLAFIGRDHWILRADIDQEDTLAAALRLDDVPSDLSIVRVSDTLTFFRITGPDADQIMAIACPLDLHQSVFDPSSVTFSEVFNLKALVQRIDGGFEFAVEQSFGNLIADYLGRAAA